MVIPSRYKKVKEMNFSGVYQIVNIANGDRYVGSSVNIARRWKQHQRELNAGTHHARALQSAWLDYGEGAFKIFVLERTEKEDLISREQSHMDIGFQYNTSPSARNSLGSVMSEETKEKCRIRGLHRMIHEPGFAERMRSMAKIPKTQEWKNRIGASLSGVKKSDDHVNNMAKSRAVISEPDLLEISSMRKSGMTIKDISEKTGRSWQQVQRICSGNRYRWAEGSISKRDSKRYNAYAKGRSHPSFNGSIYTFSHAAHGDIDCTPLDLVESFPDIRMSYVTRLIRGERKTTLGWKIKKWPAE